MVVLIGIIVVAVLFAVACRNPLKRFPVIFYLAAIALDIFAVIAGGTALPKLVQLYILLPLQRGSFAFALFAVVMFIGVFKDDSRIRSYLGPIRAELSIVACILMAAHVIRRLSVYFKLLMGPVPAGMTHVALSVVLAVFLTALMALLTITSIKALRRKMSPTSWKRIQWFAYPFFILIYVHIALLFLPSMTGNGNTATASIAFYSVVIVLYCILRIRKAVLGRTVSSIDQ